MAESLDPAVSASAVAQRHGINPSQLFTWRRQLRAAAGEASAAPGHHRDTVGLDARATADVIEMVLGGVMIRVRSGVSAAALRRVLSVLERRRC